jgi:hypothetical protein
LDWPWFGKSQGDKGGCPVSFQRYPAWSEVISAAVWTLHPSLDLSLDLRLGDMHAEEAKIRARSGWNSRRGGVFSLLEFID